MRRKLKKGFTLVELIITMLVLMIVMAAVGSAFMSYSSQNSIFRQRDMIGRYEQQARLAMLGMVRDARRSDTVLLTSVNTPATHNLGGNFVDIVLRLEAKIPETNSNITITYVLVDENDPGGKFTLHRILDPPTTLWPVAFVPALVDDVMVEALNWNPGALAADPTNARLRFLSPFAPDVLSSSTSHLSVRIVPPDSAADVREGYRGSIFETTVAINRRVTNP
jgi:type II secretory pathway pseudopilin PulG